MTAPKFYLEDLSVGQSAEFAKTVTEADVTLFAGVTGDMNPVHINEDYAQTTLFKGRIAHGMLSAGFISTVFGTLMPGPGTIYLSQNLRFKAPVRIGDTVRARCTVDEIDTIKKRVNFTTNCYVGDKLVIEGEALMMVPTRAG